MNKKQNIREQPSKYPRISLKKIEKKNTNFPSAFSFGIKEEKEYLQKKETENIRLIKCKFNASKHEKITTPYI